MKNPPTEAELVALAADDLETWAIFTRLRAAISPLYDLKLRVRGDHVRLIARAEHVTRYRLRALSDFAQGGQA